VDGLEVIGIDANSQVTAVAVVVCLPGQSINHALADDDIERLLPVCFGCY
jgi:hypothetical protein